MNARSKVEREWAANVLYTLVVDTPQRLKRGALLRKFIIDEIKNGKHPNNYRVRWVNKSAKEIIEHASKLAEEFNDKYSFDQISVDDIMDVLATAIQILKSSKPVDSTSESQAEPKLEA